MMRGRRQLDWVLFITAVALTSFGLVMVYSASSVIAEVRYGYGTYHFLVRQSIAAAVGFLTLTIISQTDYRKLSSPAWAFSGIGLSITALLAVYPLDPKHRWIHLAGVQVQPSEFAKPALVIFLAWFVTQRAGDINSRYTLMPAGLCLLALAFGVGAADMGTALVLVATAAAVFYVAQTHRKYLVMAVVATLVLLVGAILAKPYRVNRMVKRFDPNYTWLSKLDPTHRLEKYGESGNTVRDPNYQGLQSRIAVATGGPLGQGLMRSKQKLLFLPEVQTDFIFAVIGEELGTLGGLAVVSAFLVILWRGYRLYWMALDDFGRYLAIGATTCLVFQALMNVSVALDMGPTKGIPLPMVSYGGSSLLSSMILVGIILSVSEHAVSPDEVD
jgi:cell division protein FtsW